MFAMYKKREDKIRKVKCNSEQCLGKFIPKKKKYTIQ